MRACLSLALNEKKKKKKEEEEEEESQTSHCKSACGHSAIFFPFIQLVQLVQLSSPIFNYFHFSAPQLEISQPQSDKSTIDDNLIQFI